MDPVFVFLFVLLGLSFLKIFVLEALLDKYAMDDKARHWINRGIDAAILLVLIGGLMWYFLPGPDEE